MLCMHQYFIAFYWQNNNLLLWIYHILLISSWTFNSFLLFSYAAVNIYVQVLGGYTFSVLLQIFRNGLAGYMIFLIFYQVLFQSSCSFYIPTQQCRSIPDFPHPYQHLLLSVLNFSHLIDVKLYLIVVDLHFCKDWALTLFMYLLDICNLLWRNGHLNLLHVFLKVGWFYFFMLRWKL